MGLRLGRPEVVTFVARVLRLSIDMETHNDNQKVRNMNEMFKRWRNID